MPATRRRETETSPTKQKISRRRRSRPTPRWLAEQPDLDELARQRCLMILSVLSGERPVSEVIEQAQLSRQRYYDLETRALNAMLRALGPGGGAESGTVTPERRISELEQQVKQLETEKRRAERLLLLTRKVMRTGPSTKRIRMKKKRPSSTTRGSRRSSVSKTRASTPTEPPSSTTPNAGFPASIPTPDGEVAH